MGTCHTRPLPAAAAPPPPFPTFSESDTDIHDIATLTTLYRNTYTKYYSLFEHLNCEESKLPKQESNLNIIKNLELARRTRNKKALIAANTNKNIEDKFVYWNEHYPNIASQYAAAKATNRNKLKKIRQAAIAAEHEAIDTQREELKQFMNTFREKVLLSYFIRKVQEIAATLNSLNSMNVKRLKAHIKPLISSELENLTRVEAGDIALSKELGIDLEFNIELDKQKILTAIFGKGNLGGGTRRLKRRRQRSRTLKQ